MKTFVAFLLTFALGSADINPRVFPDNFKFGVANAAPQIEGGWDEDGKGETIWDHLAHRHPEKIADGTGPDIASDSYHKYKEDVAMVKAMGLDHYRLSIAWSRILPTGYPDKVNQPGVQYYKNLFKELKAAGVEPMVTLYHWDLPQPLQKELGGWLNESVADLFAEYARICFGLFNDDVKLWITINEPKQVCQSGYGYGELAPAIASSGVDDYVCSRNILLAHAKAYHIYDDEFRETNKGRIAMVIDTIWYEPGSDSPADIEAAERAMQFNYGLYGHPVHIGNWPQVVIDRVAERSRLAGYPKSRLPEFSKREIDYIKGTYDYIALNHYATNMVNASDAPVKDTGYWNDIGILTWRQPQWTGGEGGWFTVVPWGLRSLLVWLKKTYGDIEILITENGYPDKTGVMEDDDRIAYFEGYLSACLDAIYEDGINLTYYTAWTIIDDWEWLGGYTWFMGMHSVNFTDPGRARAPRKSAGWFTDMVKKRCLVKNCVK
ncbi:hypothetical protein NQ315_006543 [Exocentrus adspersus]|uniref:Beta-glucosidase n=1 Tax=Exocentrus adspersus TaxID=1586481 RepID=A0AAV8W031_9CUCU|nr:hypothetical protein NQ315_006543 [Exocentrus adspersus]